MEDHVREAMVHEQQTSLYEPGGDALHLFHDEDHLGAKLPLTNLGGVEDNVLARVDEVATCLGDDVYADHQDGVRDLCQSASLSPFPLSSSHRSVPV